MQVKIINKWNICNNWNGNIITKFKRLLFKNNLL